MSDDIKPALTPEEWSNLRINTEALNVMFDASPWGRAPEGDRFREMAIANWKLSDDDPRKITHDDVLLLEGAASVMRAEADDEWPAVERVAARLAALLPPLE